MPDRTEYKKITTYEQAFEQVLGMRFDDKLKSFVKALEKDGHTEKSIAFSIWKTQEKLCNFKGDSRFLSILLNEIKKYSWTKSDPRWNTFWQKKNEENKTKILTEELKQQQKEENKRLGVEKAKETRHKNKYPGFVYFVQGEFGGGVKIGYSQNPECRLKQLQTSYPDTLKILVLVPGSSKSEHLYHKQFENIKLNGEWFKPEKELLDEIEKLKIKYEQVGD